MRRRWFVVGLAAVALVGCSSTPGSEDLAVDVDPSSGTIVITEDDGAAETIVEGTGGGGADVTVPAIPEVPDRLEPVDGELDGEGVLVAAIVVATGDIDAALDQGVVTPAEVEAAIRAIDDGTLSDWIAE